MQSTLICGGVLSFALWRKALVVTLMAVSCLIGASVSDRADAAVTEVGPLPLGDANGTLYGIKVPDNWTGLLLIDLDYVSGRNGARSTFWLSKGYALAGINRPALRRTQYDPAKEIDNLLKVMDIFEARFGKPKRVIHWGTSAGGQLALGMAELHPDKIHGAVVGCATTPIWTSGVRFDTFMVLKALLDPDNPLLLFLGLPNDSTLWVNEWQRVFTQATTTAQGRARLALGLTLTQWNTWGVDVPRPDPKDIDSFRDSIVEVALDLHERGVETQFIFETQVGVWMGNDGADYQRYWDHADPHNKQAVAQLYEEAGLDLAAEIALVNSMPRTATNRTNAEFWLSHNARTQRGTPGVPVFRFHTIGDPLVVVSQVQVYTDQIHHNGKTPLYCTAFVEREGHVRFTVAESAAALEVMLRRLDTGRWESTNATKMNEIAASLQTGTESAFVDYNMKKFSGAWRLDY